MKSIATIFTVLLSLSAFALPIEGQRDILVSSYTNPIEQNVAQGLPMSLDLKAISMDISMDSNASEFEKDLSLCINSLYRAQNNVEVDMSSAICATLVGEVQTNDLRKRIIGLE